MVGKLRHISGMNRCSARLNAGCFDLKREPILRDFNEFQKSVIVAVLLSVVDWLYSLLSVEGMTLRKERQ